MKVIQTIQTTMTNPDGKPTDPPREVVYYNGDNHVTALAALVQAAAEREWSYVTVLDVRLIF